MLQHKVFQLEKYSRSNNIETKGIPVTQGEDCVKSVQALGEKIGCPVKVTDVDTAHRVPTHNTDHSNLIVRFCSRDKRTTFLTKARKAHPSTSCLGLSRASSLSAHGSNEANEKQSADSRGTPIYFNNHLSPENKVLFGKALALKRQHKWSFLWTDNGTIKARKTQETWVYHILCDNDLKVFRDA